MMGEPAYLLAVVTPGVQIIGVAGRPLPRVDTQGHLALGGGVAADTVKVQEPMAPAAIGAVAETLAFWFFRLSSAIHHY
jgi:hypothetical protein